MPRNWLLNGKTRKWITAFSYPEDKNRPDFVHSSHPTEIQRIIQKTNTIFPHAIHLIKLIPSSQLHKLELIPIHPNLYADTKNKHNQNYNYQSSIFPPIQFSQLFKISQHDFSGKFRFTFLASSKREGNFRYSLNGEGRFQENIQCNLESMGIEI